MCRALWDARGSAYLRTPVASTEQGKAGRLLRAARDSGARAIPELGLNLLQGQRVQLRCKLWCCWEVERPVELVKIPGEAEGGQNNVRPDARA